MKKYFIILSILIVGALSAFTIVQTLAEPVQTTIDYSGSYVWYTGISSDTIGIHDSIWTYAVQKKSLSKLMPYVYIAIDSTGGTANQVTVTLESKVFEQENYIVRETKTWKLGRDTTLSFASDSAHISEFWRVKLKGANDIFKAKVTKLNLKFVQ
jgi:hypothetical protein